MPFPNTEAGLIDANYTYTGDGNCRGCHAKIEWWETPKGKKMPLDKGTFAPHWGTCPERNQFKSNENKTQPTQSGNPVQRPVQGQGAARSAQAVSPMRRNSPPPVGRPVPSGRPSQVQPKVTFEEAIEIIQGEWEAAKVLAAPLQPLVKAVQDMDRELFSWGFYDPNTDKDYELARKIQPYVEIIKKILGLNLNAK